MKFQKKEVKDIKIVIMAGGLGTRLFPLTKKTPKALVKFKNRNFLKNNFRQFLFKDLKNFGITLFIKKI